MLSGSALYYPYIHPRETSHLKAALIYWDRVRRIVPDSVTHGDHVIGDSDDARLLVDRGLLVSTRPEPYEEAAAQQFFDFIEPKSDHFRIDIETARDMARRNRGIHIEKIGKPLFEKLRGLGMAHRSGEWVSMQEEVGAFYMFCLASAMAEDISAPLFTDSPDDAAMGQAILFRPDMAANVSEKLVRLGIRLPSPEQLRQIPMGDIADFAERHAVERQDFRAAVEEILKQASSLKDLNAVDDYLYSQRKRIETAVHNLEETLDELRVSAVSETAKITVPAGAAAAIAASHLSVAAAAILGALGFAISAISCYAETRGKLRQARASTPYHYLLAIADECDIEKVVD
jgi:hypothetical protein